MCEPELITAIKNKDNVLVEQLLLNGNPDVFSLPSNDICTALMWAVDEDNDEAVTMLINAGADLDTQDNSGLSAASYAVGRPGILKQLIDAGANINFISHDNGKNALMIAASYQDQESLALLIEAKADLNLVSRKGDTALLLSMSDPENVEAFDLLVEAGANIEVVNDEKNTPLLEASMFYRGHEHHIDKLINAGANLEAKDTQQRTSLMWSVYGGDHLSSMLLINAGANIEAQDLLGATPIFHAIKGVSDENFPLAVGSDADNMLCVKMLIDAGANINHQNAKGLTPLMLAVDQLELGVFKYLINEGCKMMLLDNQGKSALDYAKIKIESGQNGAMFLDYFQAHQEKMTLTTLQQSNEEAIGFTF